MAKPISKDYLVKQLQNYDSQVIGKKYVLQEDGKGLFSGDYNDLKNTPSIPNTEDFITEEEMSNALSGYAKTDELPDSYDDTELSNRIKTIEDTYDEHVGDTTAHITSTERTNWNDSNSKKHEHSNKSVLDGITSALITAWNNAVTHISDTVKHITSTERTNWTSAYTHSTSTHAPSNAEVNQNAFSNVVVGSTTIAADSKTDSLTLVAGSNVTLTPDATNDKITIAATDTVYTHPNSGVTAGEYAQVTVDSQGHVTSGKTMLTQANIKSYVHSAVGASGTAGYVLIATIKIKANYAGMPLVMELVNRGTTSVTPKLYIRFKSADTSDPVIETFGYTDKNPGAYLHKSATSTWDLYVQKSEAWDSINILRYHRSEYLEAKLDLTWKNVHATALPDGATAATNISPYASTSHGTHVPAIETANNAKFLRNDNTWQTVTPENIGAATSSHTHSSYVNQNAFSNVKVGDTTVAADTTTDTLTLVAGSNVTITPDATNDKITIAATDTKYTHPTTSGNKHIPSGGSSGQILRWSADGTAVWGNDNNTTYSNMTGATSSAAGKAGLVPAPASGAQGKFLRGDGTWQTPTNTTYSVATASANGLVPMFDAADGTIDSSSADWVLTNNNGSIGWYKLPANAFNNTTYNAATTSANGLMTSDMVTKLNGIEAGANKYSLPTASSTLGGVKTTSTVTSTSGLTACPIISGVPYYKDTVYTHPTTAGNKHIPSGGSSGQVLTWSSSGTATWANPSASNSSNVQYLPSTDWVQLKNSSGSWVNWMKAGLVTNYLFNNGLGGSDIPLEDGGSDWNYSSSTSGVYNMNPDVTSSDTSIVLQTSGASQCTTFGTKNKINLTMYSTLHAEFTWNNTTTTLEVDLSAISGSAYVGVALVVGASDTYVRVFAASAKSYLKYTIISQNSVTATNSTARRTCTVTKLWLT